MLQTQTVERETFELLKTLMQDNELNKFDLVGGTALALHMGHRKSIDLDLFSTEPFDATELKNYLHDKYGFEESFISKNTLKGVIGSVKVDYITHGFNLIEKPLETKDGIRLYNMKDISAMKLSAISDNGTRLKDFIDIACLSTKLSLSDMLNAYEKKYPASNSARALKGVTYYEDIDFKESIEMVEGTFNWKFFEKRISDMTKNKTKIYLDFPN